MLKEPVWRSPEIPGYLFPGYLFPGGLAGASSVLAGFAQLTGNRRLARAAAEAAERSARGGA